MNDLADEQIAELRTKAEAATPGPWETRGYKEMRGKYVVGPRKPGDMGRGPVVLMEPLFCDERSAADADFIAAARNLVPALLDALATARTERDEARALLEAAYGIIARQERAIEGHENVDAVGLRRRAEQAEAQVQAVRALCDEPASDEDMDAISALHDAGYEIALQHVRAALDGEVGA